MTTNTKLRELAEKAGSGDWYESDELHYHDDRSGEAHRLHSDEGGFIAAVCPATVLALLDENEALQAECENLRKDAERYVPLNEAVQRAATELPEGWEIQLCVMRDSGWVDLIGPDGTEDFDTDNERLDYTVIDALEFAIDAATQRDNP